MATINSVIARVDAVKINTYTAEEKARWLIELEGRIFREILRSFGEYPVSEYPADGERELITPSPYDTVYDYYLFAMIDFHNRETENYNNSIDAFNQRYDDFAKEWHRTHCAPHGGGINTMGAFAGGDAHCGKPEKDITEIIEMHNAEKAAHPYILELIAKRYTALCEIVEQYRQLSAGVATDEDISNAVAEHQNSIFAHSELFEELKNEYAKLLSAHDENDYAHYETFKKHEDKLKEIAARALESLDEHSKDEDAHGIGEKINEIEERIRKLSITGGGNGVPVISVHDELYAEIVPEEGQVYVVKYHDMPYGEDPNLISDAVFYRVKIGDGVRTLAELPVMTNIEAGTGNGSIRLVDPTYDNGDDGIDSPNNIAAGQFSVSLGKYIKNYGKAAAGFGYSNDITENGRRSFVAGANILMDAEVSAAIGFRNSLYGSKHFGWGSYLTLRGGGNIAAGKAIETTDESSNTVLLGANLETALPHKGENQVIYGQYNEEDADALVILGGGTSDTERKNALVVKKDGTILIDGKEFDKIAPFLEAIEKELSAGGLIPKYVYLKPDGSFGFEEMPGEDKTLPEYKFLQGGHSDVTNAAPSNYTEYPAEGSDSDRQWAYLGTTAKKSNSSGNFTSFGSSYAWMIGSSYDTWTAFRIRIPETGFYSVNMDYMKFTNGGIIETYILPMTAEMETEFAPENTDTYGTTASNGTGNYQERTGGKTFLQLTSIAGAKPIGDAIDTYGAESRGEWFYDEKIGEVSAEAGEYLLLFRNTRATSKGNLRFANITLTGFVPAADAIKVGETVLTEEELLAIKASAGEADLSGFATKEELTAEIGGAIAELTAEDIGASSSEHTHTASEVGASPSGHTHDDRYYTEAEIDTKLAGKAASSHTHTAADVGAVTEEFVTSAIEAAIGSAIGGSY